MPENFDLTATSRFDLANTLTSLQQTGHDTIVGFDIEQLEELDLGGLGLPELKLTRQHGRYYDADETEG